VTRRVSVAVPVDRVEEARARMLELFPDGFEEVEQSDGVELVAYTDPGGEERLWRAFGVARGEDVRSDWGERWRDFHRPRRVGPLWIGSPWHEPPASAIPLVIDPGRAFGTGAHPTTRLCLEFLLELERGSAVDLGCGSGVLAIAAAKLGFRPVVALDSDDNALAATAANAAANGVAVEVRQADVLLDPLPRAHVVLANITRPVLLSLAPRLRPKRLVSSGYLTSDDEQLPPFRHLARRTRDGWAADLYAAT
jgi:ribosomal protein L11 methyltransferase